MGENKSWCFKCTCLELDKTALKNENEKLTKANVELRQEVANLKTQVNQQHEQYFKLHSENANYRRILSTIDSSAKVAFPKLVQLSNEMTKLVQVCNIGASLSGMKDAKTNVVPPHAINGVVLNNPVIKIPRLKNNPASTSSPVQNSSSISFDLAGPSRQEESLLNIQVTRGSSKPFNFEIIQETQGEEEDEDEEVGDDRDENMRGEGERNDNDDDTLTEQDNEDEMDDNSRLDTIQEMSEDEEDSDMIQTNVVMPDIKIFINPLSVEHINRSKRLTKSRKKESLKSNEDLPSTSSLNMEASSSQTVEMESNVTVLNNNDQTRKGTENRDKLNVSLEQEESYVKFFNSLNLCPTKTFYESSTPKKFNSTENDLLNSSNSLPSLNYVNTCRGGVSRAKKTAISDSISVKEVVVVLDQLDLNQIKSESAQDLGFPRRSLRAKNMDAKSPEVKKRKRQKIKNVSQDAAKQTTTDSNRSKLHRAARPATPLSEPNLLKKLRRE